MIAYLIYVRAITHGILLESLNRFEAEMKPMRSPITKDSSLKRKSLNLTSSFQYQNLVLGPIASWVPTSEELYILEKSKYQVIDRQ